MRPVAIMDAPVLLPGQCTRCLSGAGPNRKYFVDTGVDLDFDGVVYICNTCMEDIVRSCPDFYTKHEMDSVVNSNNFLLEDARRKIKKYDDTVAALEAIGVDPVALLEKAGTHAFNAEKAFQFDDIKARLDHSDAEVERLQERVSATANLAEQNEELVAQVGTLTQRLNDKIYRSIEMEQTIERLSAGIPAPVVEVKEDSIYDVTSTKIAQEALVTSVSLFNYHIDTPEGVTDGNDGTDVDDDPQPELPFNPDAS